MADRDIKPDKAGGQVINIRREAMAKKQLEIPGAERESIPELDEVAGPYTDALYKRQALQVEENQLREQLADRMAELQIDRYAFVDGENRFTIERVLGARIKCRRMRGEDDE